ncbi:unnamed protein product [Merluccius merluccius]
METMTPMDKVCAIITDEMAVKQAVHYDEPADTIKGFEDLGKSHRSPFVANYASAFMFEYEYRAVATGLMFNNSEKTNCEHDLDNFLLQFSTYASQESPQMFPQLRCSWEECYEAHCLALQLFYSQLPQVEFITGSFIQVCIKGGILSHWTGLHL